jgi:hypothetical protein
MSKNKKTTTDDTSHQANQLPIDFQFGDSAKTDNKGKVVSIRSITEKQKQKIVNQILRETKSF